jgi:CheY-like chemotaxis protein
MRNIKNITLVDDDAVFVFLTKKAIESTQLVDHVSVFDNGQDALNFLIENRHRPDLLPEIILLDLSMPIMNGWQFLDGYIGQHQRADKKISIYVCSSSISPTDVARARAINEVSDYIIKPITKDMLIDVIRKV